MSWASRRKTTYAISFLFFFGIIFLAIAFSFFYKKPTCSDGVKNGTETGVDCGGVCQKICRADFSDPIVSWVTSENVSSGIYNVLAYATNPNIGTGALNVPYDLKIYDKQNLLLFEKRGSDYIPPTGNFAIFIGGISLNDKIPGRISFDFGNGIVWQKIDSKESLIQTVSKNLSGEDSNPKLNVTLQNNDLEPIKNIDGNGNAAHFSKTVVDLIDKESAEDIVYTWPEKFDSKIYKIDILYKILPK